MMLKFKIFILFSFVFISSFTNENIDYQHKSIQKELVKFNKIGISKLQEVHISEEIKYKYNIQGKYFKVENSEKFDTIKYVYIGRVNSCRAGGCSNSNEKLETEKYEYFDYFIFLDNNQNVKTVRIFNYQATHGQEITSKGWLNQFTNYNGKTDLEVGKNIDAISGATISVYAITFDVQFKTEILKKYI